MMNEKLPPLNESDNNVVENPQVAKLRERYMSLRLSTQEDFEDESPSPMPMGSPNPIPSTKGKKRWSLLKNAIRATPEKSSSPKSSPSAAVSSSSFPVEENKDPEEEAGKLLDFWKSADTPLDAPLNINFNDVDTEVLSPDRSESNLFDESSRPAESIKAETSEAAYVDNFAAEAKNVSLVVSRVPEEVVRKKKEQLDAEVVAEKRRDAQDNIKQQASLLYLEDEARKRVQRLQDEALDVVKKEKSEMVRELFSREAAIGREFRRAREVLEEDLKKQQAILLEKHGELLTGEQSISRRVEVKWTVAPQPIEMRIHVMRAVKNKLSKGSYVVMLTQYNRLGGQPMVWSKSGAYGISEDRPASTRPFRHYGRFFDRVLKVEDSTFALCPSPEKLKPGNVFIIELFQLATRRNPVNRVVGWAALPMCTPQFSIVEGRFKLPILRGEHSPSTSHYRTIERTIGEDLNAWLCNIYVEVKHLPKLFVNPDGTTMDEYQVEFNFMKKLLSIGGNNKQKRNVEDIESGHGELDPLVPVKQGGNAKRPEGHLKDGRRSQSVGDLYVGQSTSSTTGIARQRGKSGGSNSAESGQLTANDDDSQQKSRGSTISSFLGSVRTLFFRENRGDENDQLLADPQSNYISSANYSDTRGPAVRFETKNEPKGGRIWGNGNTTDEDDDDEPVDVLERGYDPEDEFFLESQQIGKLAGLETIGSEDDRQWAASGINKDVVRRWQSDGSRYDTEAVRYAQVPRPNDLDEKRKNMLGEIDNKGRYTTWTPLTDKKDFDLFSVAVSSDPSRRRKLLPSALVKSKLRFIFQEALGDLWSDSWGSFDFYVTLFTYLVTLWLRMVIHYIGQYFFLQAVQTPVYSFRLKVFEIVFKYVSTAVPVGYEVAVVAIGPVSNIFVFACLCLVSRLFYQFAGMLPETMSLFACAYGVWTVLDPFLILLVDIGSHNYKCGEYDDTCRDDYTSSNCDCFEGDWFKLWTRYNQDEGSGVTGMFITFMLYFATLIASLLLVYEYLVGIHKDARIMDIWRRINAPAEELFIPLDFEISLDELRTICAQANAWKGPDGASRRLVVSEYVETDPFDDSFKAITKHFAIYELSMNGKRKLYRHFLKLQDGSIIEIFEQLSVDLSAQYRTLEHLLGQDGKLAFKTKHKQIFSGMDDV